MAGRVDERIGAGPGQPQAPDVCLNEDQLIGLARGDGVARAGDAVDQHLDHCADCRHMLAEALRAVSPDSSEGGSGPGQLKSGTVLAGRYRIERWIGAGAWVRSTPHTTRCWNSCWR
jgi:hypothetical protein